MSSSSATLNSENLGKLQGKVAIVTGASSGIGASIVRHLVTVAGMRVVGAGRRLELIEELAIQLCDQHPVGQLYAIRCDMRNENDILEMFRWTTENVGPVYVLVNNAGLLRNESLFDGITETWREIFEVNVIGLLIATREAVRIMRDNDSGGYVVHINSVTGHYVPGMPNTNVYPASKHAITAITESMRHELRLSGLSKIRVTSISPGIVKTELFDFGQFPDVTFNKNFPALKVEEIANTLLFVLTMPENAQIHDIIIRPVGEDL